MGRPQRNSPNHKRFLIVFADVLAEIKGTTVMVIVARAFHSDGGLNRNFPKMDKMAGFRK